jgi:hypothetical protein
LRDDLLENLGLFMSPDAPAPTPGQPVLLVGSRFDRHEVNLLFTQLDHAEGAPVIEEFNPMLGNLFGRIEHLQVEGALVTNFRLIKAGALHRANGGTILLDARALLSEPFSWPEQSRFWSRLMARWRWTSPAASPWQRMMGLSCWLGTMPPTPKLPTMRQLWGFLVPKLHIAGCMDLAYRGCCVR